MKNEGMKFQTFNSVEIHITATVTQMHNNSNNTSYSKCE